MTSRTANHGAASEQPAPEVDVEAGDVDESLLAEKLYFEALSRRRELRRLPSLLWTAVLLVWRTNRRETLLTVALQLSGALIAALQVLLASVAVTALLASTENITKALLWPLIALAVVTLVGGLSASAGALLGRLLSIQVERRVTDEVVDIATQVELVEFENPAFYNQLSRVISTIPFQPYQVVTSMSAFVGGVAGAVALLVSLVLLAPVLALIVIAAGLPMWWLARRGGTAEFAFAVKQTTNIREREYLKDLMTRRESAAEARAYATAPVLRQRFAAFYDEFIDESSALIRRRYLLAAASALATAITGTAAMVVLYFLIRNETIDVARAAGGLVAIRLLTARLNLLVSGAATLFQSALFLDEYDIFKSRHGGRDIHPSTAPEVPSHSAGSRTARIVLTEVGFTYPGALEPAVDDVTITIEAGQVLALVGENGSGKSTLAKVLSGLYPPSHGDIRWSGELGEELGAEQAKSDITLVLQEFARYQYSVTDNIAFGRAESEPDLSAVRRAAHDAGVADMIARLPLGFDTRLSRQFGGGRDLSLGQWQRLALARAFYRDGSIVVLDEPAASLDPRAEHRLYDSVRQLLSGRTVVLITHRMRSVEGADRIIVMDRGRVVEDGDHLSLMALDGVYAELVSLQQGGGLRRA